MMDDTIRLYLYTSEECLMNILRERRLYVSRPWNTNDITEGVTQGETSQSEEVKELGYICLSETCQSPAMWGYYADRSRGACLVFDINLPEYQRKSHCIRYGAVSYADKRVSAKEKLEKRLFTKAKDWEHEREYRFLFKLLKLDSFHKESNGRSEVIFYESYIFSYLSGVILGKNCVRQLAEIQTFLPDGAHVARMNLNEDLFNFSQNKVIPIREEPTVRRHIAKGAPGNR